MSSLFEALYGMPPVGLTGAAYVNPNLARQVANARAANPRPDVTDLFGYGPDWTSYGGALRQNLAEKFPTPGATDRANIEKTLGMLSFAPFGLTVFHGSPHRFDKFDMSKIGTGEGAQAYGHGLYFAENPGVAGDYRVKLSQGNPNAARTTYYQDKELTPLAKSWSQQDPQDFAALMLGKAPAGMSNDQKAGWVLSSVRKQYPDAPLSFEDAVDDAARKVMANATETRAGHLYKVDLPDDQIAKMLDWDKPLSQQPESVKQALRKFSDVTDEQVKALVLDALGGKPGVTGATARTGGDLYRELNRYQGWSGGDRISAFTGDYVGNAQGAVSKYLHLLGIPGIRYLDGGSRAGGKGTSNFVVFDDSIPKIIGRE